MRTVLLDAARRTSAVAVLPAIAVVVALASATGVAVPVAGSPSACQVEVGRAASPATAVLGQTIRVTITVRADCASLTQPLDVALGYDTSLAMGGSRIGDMKRSVPAFADGLDMSRSRVALLSYHRNVEFHAELTNDRAALVAAAEGLFPRPGSNMIMALRGLRAALQRGRDTALPETAQVAVLLVGSPHEGDAADVEAEAQRLKDDGILLVTVALGGGADLALLERIASSPEHVHAEGTSALYPDLLGHIAGTLGVIRLIGAEVRDRLPPDMPLVWGSDVPPGRPVNDALVWRYAVWPPGGAAITFELLPESLGRQPVSRGGVVELRFDRGPSETHPIPDQLVDIVPVPSATAPPTATATVGPSPTATQAPRPVYLPAAFDRACSPRRKGEDFVLVMDTSSSMLSRGPSGEPRLTAAVLAASRFVDALVLPVDRAAIVTFGGEARLVQRLTANRAALQFVLGGLFQFHGVGSRLDLGLAAAEDALFDPAHGYPGPQPQTDDPQRPRTVVVISDGISAEREAALALAAALRLRSVAVWAVGIGDPPDEAVLRGLAGDPARYARGEPEEALQAVFELIARGGCRE